MQHVSTADRIGNGKVRGLKKRPRLREDIVRSVLFTCALVSVFTTFAIIFVLGTEAIAFFSRTAYEPSYQDLSTAISPQDVVLELALSNQSFKVGSQIKIGEEVMRVTALIGDRSIEVERAISPTRAEAHPAKSAVYIGESVTPAAFIGDSEWQPEIGQVGVRVLINATLMTSLIAMLIAGPIGLAIAIYLSEYASLRVRATIKPVLELLAGVPTVVYGYFALNFMTPLLQLILNRDVQIVGTYNMAAAGIVMGIMIIPTISSISEDALSAVPRPLREASYGLGATRLETVLRVLLPAALSGILAAFILGIARAVGETMIVAIASGIRSKMTFNPFDSAETMTGYIARISTGDISFDSIQYSSVFAIGLTLFVITFGLNIISNAIRARFREVYA